MSTPIDLTIFETLKPSRFIVFTFPNPNPNTHSLLRVAVLDSPIQPTDSPQVAAIFVPRDRESDWIFSTEEGHLQLLLSTHISRLILIGQNPNPNADNSRGYYDEMRSLEEKLKPLLLGLSPKVCRGNRVFDVPILSYEDGIVKRVMLERCIGKFVGEMLVEDVEIEIGREDDGVNLNDGSLSEFRRRLRFKRLPNLVQTQVRIVPSSVFDGRMMSLGDFEFGLDMKTLVQPYLAPMVAALSLIGFVVEERMQTGVRPRAFCVGVGGGALVSFLGRQLDFEVLGVEIDEEVVMVGRKYFGLEEDDEFNHIIVGNAIEVIGKLASWSNQEGSASFSGIVNGFGRNGMGVSNGTFDVIMVDLDASDVRNGLMAPPLEFMQKGILSSCKLILSESGILTINVIPPDRSFYETLVSLLKEVFHDLYEIDVGNGENCVLIATVASVGNTSGRDGEIFLRKLKSIIPGVYLESIRQI